MKAEAIIFDLDNTIFSVYSVGDDLFKPLFDLIEKMPEFKGDIEDIRKDVMRKPFQKVALNYQFSDKLTKGSLDILNNMTANIDMNAFDDYSATKGITCKKFLVTVGFIKMQEGKVRNLGIAKDFDEIHIIDPLESNRTKKEVFAGIMEKHLLNPADIVVVGDDPDSEIQAAQELGMQAILYDKLNLNSHRTDLNRITDYKQLVSLIG